MDIKHSLSYFTKHTGWKKIYGILIALFLINFIPIIGPILYIVFMLGYIFVLVNHRIFKPEIPLAEFNIKRIAPVGLKLLAFSIMFGSIPWILITILNTNNQDPQAIIKSLPFLIILIIVLFMLCEVAGFSYMINLKFKSFFKFDVIKYILIDNFIEYFKFSIIRFLVGISFGILFIISAITIVGPILLAPMPFLVIADLNAQFLKELYNIETKHIGTQNG